MTEFAHETQVTAIDPVCGMELPLEKVAAYDDYRGRAYVFCSRACHRRFRNAPARYAGAPVWPAADHLPAV